MLNLIKFGTSHCGMCKVMDKILNSLDNNIDIMFVDAEINIDLANKHNIRSVPVTILFDNDKEICRWNGVITKQVIESKIKEYESEHLV